MPEINEVYQHYKGGLYRVIAIGKHTDDLSEQVVYSSMKDDQIWVRSLQEWNTPVDGRPRFVRVKDDPFLLGRQEWCRPENQDEKSP